MQSCKKAARCRCMPGPLALKQRTREYHVPAGVVRPTTMPDICRAKVRCARRDSSVPAWPVSPIPA